MAEINTFPRITPLLNDSFPGNELNKRKQSSFGGLQKAKPRSVWVRAVSNAFASGGENFIGPVDERLLGDKNIMVGGLLAKDFATRGSFETLYKRPGRILKDRAIPGLTGISITSKGEFQQLRKVVISWECPGLEDLDELAPYWLTPGISIWIEWGWAEHNIIPKKADIKSAETLAKYYADPKLIYNDLILPSNGNQEGYLGIISNFTWNSNDDGSFSCTTELTSLGTTFLVLDINKDKVYKGAALDLLKSGQKTQTIKGFIDENFNEEKLKKLPLPSSKISTYREKTGETKWKETKDVFLASRSWKGMDWAKKDRVYVTWRFIEEAIINQNAILLNSDGKPVYKFDSEDVLISNDQLLYSTNGEVVLLSHQDKSILNFDAKNSHEGFMRNLYVETDFIKDIFENSETLEEALNKILRGMSEACANIWNFKIQPKARDEKVLEVIDMNFTSQKDLDNVKTSMNDNLLSLGGFSGESILTDLQFTSKLTDQLALKYFVGRNKDKSTESGLIVNDDNDAGIETIFGGYSDRVFKRLVTPPSPPEDPDVKAAQIKKAREEAEKEEKKRKDYAVSFKEFKDALLADPPRQPKLADDSYAKDIIILSEDALEILTEYLNRETKENQTRNTPLYPLEISVTIDGISGILPGHCFTLDNLPKLYKNTGVFQIVEIAHEIKEDDWQTTLRAFFRVTKTVN